MSELVRQQLTSYQHRIAVTIFPIIILLAYIHPYIFGAGMIIFFLITSFRYLKTMLFYMLILTGAMIVFAPLAPVLLIVLIVLFFLRIGYVLAHWRPFLAGLMLYGAAGFLMYRATETPYVLYFLIYPQPFHLIEPILASIIGFFFLRQILIWLYHHNYTSFTALGMMGSVPLIIISFILPFLKMHIGDVFVSEGKMISPEGKVALVSKPGEFVNPHYVQGHYRSDGTYVEGYWRDGDGNTSHDLSKEEGGGYIRRGG